MGISSRQFNLHLAIWSRKFNRNYRQIWVSRLFHHTPLENAISVITTGQLLSRNQAQGVIVNDIAPVEIVNRTETAHSFVRLYFRPRNPTQYHIEGIRRPDEYCEGKHSGILVFFVFKADEILTKHDTEFSDGNLQSGYSTVFSSDQEFSELDFGKFIMIVLNLIEK